MLELYHNDMSVCAQKVRLAVAEQGLEYTGHLINLRSGDQKKPGYVKLNPKGVVPTLVHDGFVVCDSVIINEYINDSTHEGAQAYQHELAAWFNPKYLPLMAGKGNEAWPGVKTLLAGG